MKNFKSIVIFVLALLFVPSFANESLTLDQLKQMALENDLQEKIDTINIKKLQIEQYDAHKHSTKYESTSENAGEVLRVYNNNVVAPEKADDAVKYAMIERLKNKDKLLREVEMKTANFYLLDKKIERAKEIIAFTEKKRDVSKLKLELGMVIELDLAQAENDVNTKKRDLEGLIAEKTSAELELKSIIGMDLNQPLTIDYQITEPTEFVMDIAPLSQQYQKYALKVVEARDKAEIDNGIFEKVKEEYHPNVNQYKQASLNALKSTRLYQEAEKNAQIDFEMKYAKLRVEYDELVAAKESVVNAEKEFANAELKFKLGTISEIDKLQVADKVKAKHLLALEAFNQYAQSLADFKLMYKDYVVDITPRDYDMDDYYKTEDIVPKRAN